MHKIFNLLVIILLSQFCHAQIDPVFDNLVWSDEFNNDTLNISNWNIEVIGETYNGEIQYYTDRTDNIKLENGNLVITALEETYTGPLTPWGDPTNTITRNYTSARINSNNKRQFQYGRFEARIKLPYGNGVFPAFWLMGTDVTNWPANGEIDIMELVGGTQCSDCGDNIVHGTGWYENAGQNTTLQSASYQLFSGNFADNFHVFAVEWNSTTIKWFVDDVQFHSVTITGVEFTEFHNPMHILLNFAIGGEWSGNPTTSTIFPQELIVDYVRVYQESITSTSNVLNVAQTKIYPNPMSKFVIIELPIEVIGAQITITSVLGNEIMKYIQNEKNKNLDLSDLDPSVYFILVENKRLKYKRNYKIICQ